MIGKALPFLFLILSAAAQADGYRVSFAFYTGKGNIIKTAPALSDLTSIYVGDSLTYGTMTIGKSYPFLSTRIAYDVPGSGHFYFGATTIEISSSEREPGLVIVKAGLYQMGDWNFPHTKKWRDEILGEKADEELRERGARLEVRFVKKRQKFSVLLPVINDSSVAEFIAFNSYGNARCEGYRETQNICDEKISLVEVILEKTN